MEDTVEDDRLDDSDSEVRLASGIMSECAMVYLTVTISSSSGIRNETRFVAGNSGRLEDAILRVRTSAMGLLDSMDGRLCASLYGIRMVTDSVDDADEADVADAVDAELGVLASSCIGVGGVDRGRVSRELMSESRGLEGAVVDAGSDRGAW